MADRIVYLVDKLTKATKASTLEFLTDARLGELMTEGYTVDKSIERKAEGVACTMMILKSPEDARGVTVRRAADLDDDERPIRRERGVTIRDEFGQSRSLSVQEAMIEGIGKLARGLTQQGEHPGHLGSPGSHNLPGLTVISGYHISRAWDMGQTAQRAGYALDQNPFPEGTAPHTKWIDGWRTGSTTTENVHPDILAACRAEGAKVADTYGRSDVVHCPYYGDKKSAWLEGFTSHGGVVE